MSTALPFLLGNLFRSHSAFLVSKYTRVFLTINVFHLLSHNICKGCQGPWQCLKEKERNVSLFNWPMPNWTSKYSFSFKYPNMRATQEGVWFIILNICLHSIFQCPIILETIITILLQKGKHIKWKRHLRAWRKVIFQMIFFKPVCCAF